MATVSIRIIFLIGLIYSSHVLPELNIVRIEGPCNFTQKQRNIAWNNVTKAIEEQYPEVLPYCETDITPTTKTFIVVDGICRARFQCDKIVDGTFIMHGHFIVEVEENTPEVRGIHDVPW